MNARVAGMARAGTSRRLLIANAVLVAAILGHGLDHVLQDRGLAALSTEVFIGGFVNFALGGLLLALAWRGSPAAPLASAVGGTWIALGLVSAHFTPDSWSLVSDPYAGLGLGLASWLVAGAEALAGVWVAVVGLAELRLRRVSAGTL